jgi:copper transport protein
LGVKLKPGLAHGTYTAAYRVISADGHPVEGGVTFSIGKAGAQSSKSIDQLIGSGKAGVATQTAFDIDRGLDYLAIALSIGLVAFMLFCWQRGFAAVAGSADAWTDASEAVLGRARTLLVGAAVLGLLVALLGIVFEGATAGGTSFWTAIDWTVVRDVLHTRFGTIWGLKVLVWVVLLGSVLLAGPRRTFLPLVPAALLALAPAFSGHADTQGDKWLLVPSDIAHVSAMSVWIGGLVALLVLVPRATAKLQSADRSRLLASVLLRFSPVALGSVIVLMATGTLQSIEYLRSFGDLLHTAFGRAVLIKIILILGLTALGAINRRRLVPRIETLAQSGGTLGEAGRAIRATLRAEVAMVVTVLGVTAALVGYQPPDSLGAAAGGVNIQKRVGPLLMEATVDPARLGPNTMHLYFFEAKGGSPFNGTKEITATATLKAKGLGPLPIKLSKAGPGHWVANSFQLSPAGAWTVDVVDRVSVFDQYETSFVAKVAG